MDSRVKSVRRSRGEFREASRSCGDNQIKASFREENLLELDETIALAPGAICAAPGARACVLPISRALNI